jgi:transposase
MRRDRFDHKVDRMVDHKVPDPQRAEVITDVSRRRSWPSDFKARVVAESLEPDAVISEGARRHGLKPQQLFSWRNQLRSHASVSRAFAPVVVEAAPRASARVATLPRNASAAMHDLIEVVVKGTVVRIHVAVDADTLAAVLLAAVLRAVTATASLPYQQTCGC